MLEGQRGRFLGVSSKKRQRLRKTVDGGRSIRVAENLSGSSWREIARPKKTMLSEILTLGTGNGFVLGFVLNSKTLIDRPDSLEYWQYPTAYRSVEFFHYSVHQYCLSYVLLLDFSTESAITSFLKNISPFLRSRLILLLFHLLRHYCIITEY